MSTSSMKTIFNFVLEQGGGGDTPGGNVVAQTGDMLAIILTILFAICAIAASVYLIVKAKNFKNATSNGNHTGTKTFVQAKTLIVFLVAMLGIVGAITCAANTSAGRAFASGTANEMEFKDHVTVTVHEDTKTLSFEDNYFTNDESGDKHIDRSFLTLSDEAKELLGGYKPNLTAKYANGDTYVFNGKADDENPYKPFNQTALSESKTQNIVYGTLDFNYDVAKQLCELTDPLTIELCQANCCTVTYDKGDATSGTAPRSQTVSQPGQPQVVQTTTIAPANTGNLQKSGFRFTGWNTKPYGQAGGTHYNVGDTIEPSDVIMYLYPDWENTSGLQITFNNDGKGKAALEGQTPPATDLVVTLPVNTTYTVSDAGKITFTKPDKATVVVVPYAEKYISYAKWERNGEEAKSGTITDNNPFTVSFTYDEFTIKYQGAYPDDPHGTMKPNDVTSEEVTYFEETFQPANPTNAKAPKGVTAIQLEEKPDDAQYLYYFVNWTDSEGKPVPVPVGDDPKKIVPTEGSGWKDATYIVHYATPKAIYSENAQTGENLMKFYYDEDPHPEAKQGDRNNAFKFYVNESKFEWDEDWNITNIVTPSWFTPAIMSAGKILAYPTPMVWPTKVEFDAGFKNFKNLKSTDMWFMDAEAISVLEMLSAQNGASVVTKTKTRQIKSIVGLENVYTENIESTALMFAAGSPIPSIAFPVHAQIVNDPLESLDLLSWTNLPKLTGQMTGMFAGCNNLVDLKLPLNKESNFGAFATDATALFYACTGLTSISINNNFCQKSPNMSDVFANCTSLQELKVSATSSFGENAERIDEMFLNCAKLCDVDLSSLEADADASSLFTGCLNLIKIILPAGFEQRSDYIGLNEGRDWYYYNASQGSYSPIEESQIGEKNGGTFTRLAPKAIYNSDDSTLTFYYDYESHDGEGQSFLINKVEPNERSTIASLFPTWYEVNIYVDDNKVQYVKDIADPSLKGRKVTSYIELKAPANTVIFDQSFVGLKDSDQPLQYIFGWFMADSIAAHANCLHEFKSKNLDGTWATDKFAYFPSDTVTMWACPFGGFSMEVLYEISNGFFSGLGNPLDVLNSLGNNGEEDAYFSGADTFSAATSLDLSSLKIHQRAGFNALGLVANSPSLTKITMPKTGDSEAAKGPLTASTPSAQLNWAFMNCSSLTEISEGFMTKQWNISGIYKTFYGCTSLETLDLTKFNYQVREAGHNASSRQFYTFKNCNKLYQISMDGELWRKGSVDLNMEQCSLPAGVWHINNLQDKDLSTSEIPVCDGESLSGTFYRDKATSGKTVTFEVDGTGGSISPESASVTIYGDTDFAWDGNDIIINGQTIKAVPDSTNAVKSWTLNDQRINQSGFADPVNTIQYSDAESFVFKVTFVSGSLKPKAVYDENDKTLTFYYDTEPHTGEGLQVFDVYKDTHFNINTNNLTIDAKLPAWYDYTVSKSIDAQLSNFSFNTQLKIDASKVIFSKSFIDYDDLESISMWFMADHSGKQTFKEFYSEAENGQLIPGFSNINTTSVENVSFAFGGFSMLASALNTQVFKSELDSLKLDDPSSVDYLTKLIKVLTGEDYNKQYDTFGSSLQNIDISTFDQAHNVSNYSALFCNCRSLYSIELGESIKDANITNMSAMFQNCESLGLDPSQTEIIKHLDQLDTSNTTNMDLLFFGDFNIKNFNLAKFNTEKTIVPNASFGNPSWNTRLMFWDCTRLSSITISSKFNKDKEGFVEGWATPLIKCYLMDNYDPEDPGQTNKWTNTETGKTVDSTMSIPFMNYPPKEDEVITGTFTRKPLKESKTIFKVEDPAKGTVNGQESVTYSYIQTDNVRLDQNKPSDMLSDNYRITPEPISANYKFDHWETGKGFDVQGKVVTAQDQWLFDVRTDLATERELVAVFEDAAKSAKAVYEKPTEANGTGHLTFYYDSESHTGANVEVFDVKTDTGVYNLPAWYEESDIDPWVEGEDRPVPYFSNKIDTGIGHPDTIVVNFDSSFAQFRQLTSLSCWFMPAIDRNNNNALYHPFKFDSDNFQGLKNINTESVYNLWYMFGGHENANDYSGSHTKEINLTDFDTEHKLQNLDGLFANCVDLETLTLPTGFGTNSKSMSHTFFNCRALTNDKLSSALSNLKTDNVEDMSYMFASYKYESATETDSTTLIFPASFNIGRVQTVEGMFAGYTNTHKLIVSNSSQKLARNSCRNWSYLFANNHSESSALESIDWSNLSWLNPASAQSMQGMFMNNTAIKNLDFINENDTSSDASHFNTSGVTDMSYMFSGCSSLEKYDFTRKFEETFQTIKAQNMSHMFENTALTSVNFKDGFLSVYELTNSNHMFSGCSLLEDVNLDRSSEMGLVATIVNAMYMFENCPSIEKINLENFNVSGELIPEDETDPNAEMVASVYNMFVNTDESGNVSANSKINEFTIGRDWGVPMDRTGLATMSGSNPVLWCYKNDWTVTGFSASSIPTETITLPDHSTLPGYGTFTNEKPHNFTLAPNKKLWGEVVTNEGASSLTQYMGSVQLSVVSGSPFEEVNNVLMVKLSNFDTPVPVFARHNPSKSDFVGWQVYDGSEDEPITINLGETKTFNTDIDIQAVFANGVTPVAAYGPDPESPEPQDVFKLRIDCTRIDDYVLPEGWTIVEMPEDGDFSKTEYGQAPWTKTEVASKIKEVYIEYSISNYEEFTSFNGWFKNLNNLEFVDGLYFLNTANGVDFTSMFEGCSTIDEILLGSLYDMKTGRITPAINNNSITATNMFNGCNALKTLMLSGVSKIEEGSDMFTNCSNLTMLGLSENLNKNLKNDLGFEDSNWCFSGQSTLSSYGIADIQDKMKKTKDLGIGYDVYVLGKVKDTSKILTNDASKGQITDNLRSGQYANELTACYNNDEGITCSAIRTDTSLILSFVLKPQTEFMSKYTSTWKVTVNNKAIEPYMFYEWNYNDAEIGSQEPVSLSADNDITAKFDVQKYFVAVYNSDEQELKFYFDQSTHEDEGDVTFVPKQWYKENDGIPETPFKGNANKSTKVVFNDSVADYKSLFDTWSWFNGFTELKTIEGLGNLKLANVTNFGYMFNACRSLESIDFSESDGNLTPASFAYMFSECENLQSIDLSTLYTNGNYIGDRAPADNMLNKCTGLTKITFGDKWQRSFMSSMGEGLSPHWNNVDQALSVDSSQFPNTEYAGSGTFEVAPYSASFCAKDGLEITSSQNIYFSDSITAKYLVDEATKNLKVALTNKSADTHEYPINVKRTNQNIKFDKWLKNDGQEVGPKGDIEDNDKFEAQYTQDNNVAAFYFDKGSGTVTFAYDQATHTGDQYDVPTVDAGEASPIVKRIGDASNIRKVVFEESFKNFTDITSLSYWFYQCFQLDTIQGIEYLNTMYVTSCRSMFQECSSLTSLDLSSWDTSNVRDMKFMFTNCSSLGSLTFGDNFNTEKVEDFTAMFSWDSKLKELDLSSFSFGTRTRDIPDISEMLWGLSEVETIDLSVKVCKYDYLTEGYKLGGGNCIAQTPNLKKIVSNGKLKLNLNEAESFSKGTWVDPDDNIWETKILDKGGEYLKCSVISFSTNEIVGGSLNITDSIPFVPGKEYATYETGTDAQGNNKVTIELYQEGQDEPYARPQSRVYTLDSESSYTWDKWDISPEPTDNKITEDTTITACVKDSKSAKAVYTKNKDTNDYTLTFYYDDQTHTGDKIVSVPKHWGMSAYSSNYEYERARSPFAEGELEPFAIETVKVVFDESFANCQGIGSMSAWFSNFTKVTNYEGFENIDTTYLGADTDAGFKNTFANNTSLENINVSALNTKGDTKRGISACASFANMFFNCLNLKNVVFTDEGGQNTFCLNGDVSEMFSRCKSLKSVNLSSMDKFSVSKAQRMFEYCYKLESLNLGQMNFGDSYTVQDLIKYCFALNSFTSNNTSKSKISFPELNPTLGNWMFDGTPIGIDKETLRVGTYTRSNEELCTITFEATGERPNDGRCYIEGWDVEDGYIDSIVLPVGTELYKEVNTFRVTFKETNGGHVWKEPAVFCTDIEGKAKPTWKFESPFKVTQSTTLQYDISDKLMQNSFLPDNNVNSENTLDPQGDPIDPVEPQVDPVVPEGDEGAPLAAGALALPALAALGIRKRIRGKHAKI